MKCPMLKSRYSVIEHRLVPQGNGGTIPKEVEIAEFQDCIQDKCAWWVGTPKPGCSIYIFASIALKQYYRST